MGTIVFTKTKAICLLFLTLLVLEASAEEAEVFFTTSPKNKEIFVGEDVQFDWEYARTDVQEVRFGVVVNDSGSRQEVTISFKQSDGTLVYNTKSATIKWIWGRVEIVPNKRASFRINKVKMTDTRTYYCTLVVGEDRNFYMKPVKLTVVDLMIDKGPSSTTVESWEGRKITVVCAVKVPPGITNPKFSWMHIPSNITVAKEFHDDTMRNSYLTITMYKDEDFEALQCRAETKATVKFHVINITKLSSPSEPRNLKAERSFDKENARPFIRLHWDPPRHSGGAIIGSYIIWYIPSGLSWKSKTTKETTKNEYNDLKLPNGRIYNVVVRAKNKAGISPPSNEIEINMEDNPQLSLVNSSTLRHHLMSCLLLLSLVVWFL